MVQRYCTTLVDYAKSQDLEAVEILAPRHVFTVLSGTHAFNRIFTHLSADQIRQLFRDIKSLPNGPEDEGLLELLFEQRVLNSAPSDADVDALVRYLRCRKALLPGVHGRVLNTMAARVALDREVEGLKKPRTPKQFTAHRIEAFTAIAAELRRRGEALTSSELSAAFHGRFTNAFGVCGKHKGKGVPYIELIGWLFISLGSKQAKHKGYQDRLLQMFGLQLGSKRGTSDTVEAVEVPAAASGTPTHTAAGTSRSAAGTPRSVTRPAIFGATNSTGKRGPAEAGPSTSGDRAAKRRLNE